MATLWYQPPTCNSESNSNSVLVASTINNNSAVAASTAAVSNAQTTFTSDNIHMKKPKGYISAFNFYVQHAREGMLRAHPKLKVCSFFHPDLYSCILIVMQ